MILDCYYEVHVRNPRLYWWESGEWYTAKSFLTKELALAWANANVKKGSCFKIRKMDIICEASGEVHIDDYHCINDYTDFTVVGGKRIKDYTE